jgi:transposase-like protein
MRCPVMCDLTNPTLTSENRAMAKQEFSLPALAGRLQTEADAYLLLEELRWGGKPDACPHCGGMDRIYFLKPREGTARKTRTGSMSQRRVWKCGHCRKQFSVLTGTIFHGTRISIRTWLFVIFEMCSSKNGVAAREIERKYNVTAKSAWFMNHRIREAMKRDPLAGLLSGTIQADETYIGGEPKNRHRSDRRERDRRYGTTDQIPVFALVDFETREVRSQAVPDVTGETLREVMREQLDMPNV